jgi:hypothetical protein
MHPAQDRESAGSNPAARTIRSRVCQLVLAAAFEAASCRFDSGRGCHTVSVRMDEETDC